MSSDRIATISVWISRGAWVFVLAFGMGAFAATTDGSAAGRPAVWVAGVLVAAGWTVGAGALAFRSTITLTIGRAIVPASLGFACWWWVGGGATFDVIGSAVAGAIASVSTLGADFGNSYVQASAYGAERRALLRPPAAYLGLATINWLAAVGAIVGGTAALIDRRWWVAAAALAFGTAAAAWGGPRWHKLARRWLVLVPVGLVIHDHVLLADTIMLGRRRVGALRLVRDHPAEALDLTGTPNGPTVEIEFADLETVTLAANPAFPAGRAFHARNVLVAPSRPGRFLTDASAARLPVDEPVPRSTDGEVRSG